MKMTNPKNGEQFDSPHDNHSSAHAAILARINSGECADNKFATDIAKATTPMKGECQGSAPQLYWLHKLASQGAKREAPKSVANVNLTPLKVMLTTAKESGLKYPSLNLTTASGREVRLTLAKNDSKNPGAVYVQSGSRGGLYYGKVTAEGDLFAGRDFIDEVGEMLVGMSNDPLGFAAKQGHLTGSCCFCRKKLTDGKSTTLGYGKSCAYKFGLAYSAKAARAKKADSGLRGQVEKDLFGEPPRTVRRITRRRIENA